MFFSSFILSLNTYYLLTEGISLEFDIFKSNLINLVLLGGLIVHRIFFPAYRKFFKRREFMELAFLESIQAEEELRLLLIETYQDVFLRHKILAWGRDFYYVQVVLEAAQREQQIVAPQESFNLKFNPIYGPLLGGKPTNAYSALLLVSGFMFPMYESRKREGARIVAYWPTVEARRREQISPVSLTHHYLNCKRVKCVNNYRGERNLLLKFKSLAMQDLFIKSFKQLMLSFEMLEMTKREVKLVLEAANNDFQSIQDILQRISEIILGDDFNDFIIEY